jgi:ABC-type multidrug transport system fused ATPase/permease subunit
MAPDGARLKPTGPSLLKRLWPLLQPYRARFGAYFGIVCVSTALSLLAPWPMKIVVDSVIGDRPLPLGLGPIAPHWLSATKLRLLVGTIAAGIALKAVVSLLQIRASTISVTVRQRVVLDLKSKLLDHVQRQSLTFYDGRRIGDLVYRINTDVWGIDEIITAVLPLGAASLTLLGMLGVIGYLNLPLMLLALVIAPLFYATYGFYSRHFEKRQEEVQRLEGESMSIVHEVLSSVRVIKAFTREEHEHSRFVRHGYSAADARIRLTTQQVVYSAVVGLITLAGTSLMLGAGAWQILRGALTLGELLVILAYLASVYGPLESISTAATYVSAYRAKLKRIFEILDTEPEIRDHPGARVLPRVRGNVVFEQVSFAYPGRTATLVNADFEVRPGQVTGIVGPTGAGKTTLLSLIPRFYSPTEGRVLVDGHDIRDVTLKSLRQQIGLVLQETVLFHGTIRENIEYGRPGARVEEIVEAAKMANAHEFISALPEGYETEVGERGFRLSGGEKQRIAIARAFLKDAPILILDEPTSALDSQTEAQVLVGLRRLMKGRTTFIIAHRLSTLRDADTILVMERGGIVERGRHEELASAGGLYATLHRHQSGRMQGGPIEERLATSNET